MNDDLSLDLETVDAQLAEPLVTPKSETEWHSRRSLGWGASDIAALELALGRPDPGGTPKYMLDKLKITNKTFGEPRIFAEKAGLVSGYKAGPAAAVGTARERELMETWCQLLESGQVYHPIERKIDASRVTHADAMLRSCWPMVDRHCPQLTCTLDGWTWDDDGNEVVVEIKCTATERHELPWYWETQVQAQLAVTGAAYGLVVCGEFWAAPHRDDGPVRCWHVPRDERAILAIRMAARRGWDIVERLKQQVAR